MVNRKNDIKYHKILKQASIFSYLFEKDKNDGKKPPVGYRVIESFNDKKTGLQAKVLFNGKDIIIAYRGTDNFLSRDILNDLVMVRGDIPEQATMALSLYDKYAGNKKHIPVTVTGHSLGGSLAEIVSGIRGGVAVTFNAYGVRDMFKSGIKLKEDNIVNYVNEKDFITMVNGQNHIGEIYAIYEKPGNAGSHEAESIGDLSQRKMRTPEEIKQTSQRLYPNMTRGKEFLSGEMADNLKNDIRQKIGDLKSTINKKRGGAEKAKGCSAGSQCVGSYTVSGYTRSDGTKVGDYIRTCGAKHANQ